MSRSVPSGKRKGIPGGRTARAKIWRQEIACVVLENPGCLGECGRERVLRKVGRGRTGLGHSRTDFWRWALDTEERGTGL